MILALILFAVTYVLMLRLQQYRPWVALCSAVLFIVLGEAGVYEFSLRAALQAVDYNVLLMMAGTMGTVALFIESKMPARLAEMLIVRVPDVKWAVCMLALFAGVISAFVDNVATVLMVAPVGLAIARKLKISPVPVLIAMMLLTVGLLIAASFLPEPAAGPLHTVYELRSGLVCMGLCLFGVARACLRAGSAKPLAHVLGELDCDTLLLLFGLFIVIAGIHAAGVIDAAARLFHAVAGESPFRLFTLLVVVSVVLSAFIDNIPYVAAMLPVVQSIAALMNDDVGVEPYVFYFGLLTGATLGGNLTPIGASANIAAIGILRKNGETVTTRDFLRIGVPFTLAAVLAGYAYLWLVWGKV